jgi:hypothetical protein
VLQLPECLHWGQLAGLCELGGALDVAADKDQQESASVAGPLEQVLRIRDVRNATLVSNMTR